jgi:RNA-directed DNA polymerase
MTLWRPQIYRTAAPQGIDPTTLDNAVQTGSETTRVDPSLPPIFSLRHLAHILEVDYGLLRAIIGRKIEDPYKVFRIRKRPGPDGEQRFRIICVPNPTLLHVQRWINARILIRARPHASSFAFAKGNTIYAAAERHCAHRWLIKFDVVRFFESISEIAAYRVFHRFGYQPLVAFELSRLCTRLGSITPSRKRNQWSSSPNRYPTIGPYAVERLGHLPQGAPTSPMLANLAMVKFDEAIQEICDRRALVYTRYADDIILSTDSPAFGRGGVGAIIGEVYKSLGRFGLSPNVAKTHISPPGARKVVLGLTVDGPSPRLTREFKGLLGQHLYYLASPRAGPIEHAKRRGFRAIAGLRNHVQGLVAFARQIEPTFGDECAERLAMVSWPL